MSEPQQPKAGPFQRLREWRERARADKAQRILSRPKDAPKDRYERSGAHKSGGRGIGPG